MNKSIISLKITSFFYVLFSISVMSLPFLIPQVGLLEMSILSTLSFSMAFLHFKVMKGLQDQRYWAWVVSIIIFGFLTVSIFFPLGIIGLCGVLNKETRAAFARSDLEFAQS